MRTTSGVLGRGDDTVSAYAAGSRILWGFLLAVIGSVGFIGGNVEVSQASQLHLASYGPAESFSGLSLKNSSTISARFPQETFASRYDVVSKLIEPTIPTPLRGRAVSRDFAEAVVSQAACYTGGLFDACPGFVELLHRRQQAWPRFGDVALPAVDMPLTTASVPRALVAGEIEKVSLVTEDVVAPVDRLSMRVGEVIIGAASTYNPYDKDDNDAGGVETASGELYNPIAWTAAIQIDLRGKFAGVRYGRLYQPSFALVQLNGKRAIVRINDVGPLRPGRVIDLSTQAMHYFDPTLERGVLDGMLVTPLVGSNWTPGPLGTTPVVAVAGNFL